MKKYISFVAVMLLVLTVSSCYKILNTHAPSEVTAGETFQVTVTVAYDGDDNPRYKKDWSLAGLRVPKGWTVTAPSMNHRAYAEDWVYYEDGTPAAKRASMKKNANLTKIYNEACVKEGYEWYGFQTRMMVPKYVTACWRNGCDSIVGTFNVTVPADYAAGTYTIDFIAGDEEDEVGADKYTSYKDALPTRVFHASTFRHSSIERVNLSGARKIVVKANPTAIKGMSEEKKSRKNIYTISGMKVKEPKKGINIIGGKKIVRK